MEFKYKFGFYKRAAICKSKETNWFTTNWKSTASQRAEIYESVRSQKATENITVKSHKAPSSKR